MPPASGVARPRRRCAIGRDETGFRKRPKYLGIVVTAPLEGAVGGGHAFARARRRVGVLRSHASLAEAEFPLSPARKGALDSSPLEWGAESPGFRSPRTRARSSADMGAAHGSGNRMDPDVDIC